MYKNMNDFDDYKPNPYQNYRSEGIPRKNQIRNQSRNQNQSQTKIEQNLINQNMNQDYHYSQRENRPKAQPRQSKNSSRNLRYSNRYNGYQLGSQNAYKFIINLTLLGIVGLIISAFGWSLYNEYYNPPGNSVTGKYSFEVKKGDTLKNLQERLAKDRVISNPQVLSYQNQFKNVGVLQEGDYTLSLPMKPEQILDEIRAQSAVITNRKREESEFRGTAVLIKEGVRVDDIAEALEKNNIWGKADFLNVMTDQKKYQEKRAKYSFLPEPLDCKYGDTENCAKYLYEGYLYPDTYNFLPKTNPRSSIDLILDRFLDNFKVRVWDNLQRKVNTKEISKESLDPENFRDAIIMASVIEKESGRPIEGVNKNNIDELSEERKKIASVFYNRMKIDEKWASDPTGTYWAGKTFCQQTLEVKDCILLNDPLVNNKYNTYQITGYPIGPITSPQADCILAALTPSDTDYLYFVSDRKGKKYFAKTNQEHENNIAKVKEMNN